MKTWIQTLKEKAYIVIANAQPANDLLEPGVGVPVGAFRLTNRPDQLLVDDRMRQDVATGRLLGN